MCNSFSVAALPFVIRRLIKRFISRLWHTLSLGGNQLFSIARYHIYYRELWNQLREQQNSRSFICFPSIKRDFDGNLLQSAVGAGLEDAPALRVHFHFDLVRLFPECISDWRDDTLGSNELLVLNKRSTAAGHNISCIRATYHTWEPGKQWCCIVHWHTWHIA